MVMEMFACASISCTILGCVPLYNLSCPLDEHSDRDHYNLLGYILALRDAALTIVPRCLAARF